MGRSSKVPHWKYAVVGYAKSTPNLVKSRNKTYTNYGGIMGVALRLFSPKYQAHAQMQPVTLNQSIFQENTIRPLHQDWDMYKDDFYKTKARPNILHPLLQLQFSNHIRIRYQSIHFIMVPFFLIFFVSFGMNRNNATRYQKRQKTKRLMNSLIA